MQQCYSGGFIYRLQGNTSVILTSVGPNSIAVSVDDVDPDGDYPNVDPYEKDFIPPSTFHSHGEFAYHVLNAARLKTVFYLNPCNAADTNSDGLASMQEIWDWEDLKDPLYPQFSNNGGIAQYIILNTPPSIPQNLDIIPLVDYVILDWDRNPEWDCAGYRIYRCLVIYGQPPTHFSLLAEINDPDITEYNDYEFNPMIGEDIAAYKVSAVDLAGQEGELSDYVWTYGTFVQGSYESISSVSIPYDAVMLESYPNPFNSSTNIKYYLHEPGRISLKIYNVNGKEIMTLAEGWCSAGFHDITWDAGDLPSGIYFVSLQVNGECKTQKLLLTK